MEFEWESRLSELQRRNTMCLPHQKTSYPVETITMKNEEATESEIQTAAGGGRRRTLPRRPSMGITSKVEKDRATRKRRSTDANLDESMSPDSDASDAKRKVRAVFDMR